MSVIEEQTGCSIDRYVQGRVRSVCRAKVGLEAEYVGQLPSVVVLEESFLAGANEWHLASEIGTSIRTCNQGSVQVEESCESVLQL